MPADYRYQKNKYQKGIAAELKCSVLFHQRKSQYIPLLVSSIILSRRACGQIDLSRINQEIIEVCEVKRRKNKHGSLSYKQKNRLGRSCEFLGIIFEKAVILKIWEL